MNRKIITTNLGKTVYASNQKMYGKRTLPVLYLHGGPGHANLEIVDAMDYDGLVETYAQFGCGGSDEKDEYTPELFVEQLREIIEKEFNGCDFVLSGGSWGGALALLYIDRYGTDHISGLVLSSPLVNSSDSDRVNAERISRLPGYIREKIDKGNREGFFGETYCLAYRGFFRDYFGGKVSEHMADWCFGPSNDVYVQMWGNDESRCTGCTKDLHLESMLDKIDIPVLYISGEHDLHSVDDVKRYCSKIRDVELHILEGTGHFSGSHPDYDSIIKEFIHRVDRTVVPEKEEDSFRNQDDYDMILSDSPHDTPEHLVYAASKMTLEECKEEARRYETGDERPQSYLSASIFYERCDYINKKKWEIPRGICFGRQYDAKDAERRLIVSPRGIESYCCRELRDARPGYSCGSNSASLNLRGHGNDLKSCPFCGKEMEFIAAGKQTEISDDDGFFRLKDRYLNEPMTIEEAVSADYALRRYSFDRVKEDPCSRKYDETRGKHHDIQKERINNVTGMLTASSAGLESVCCEKLRDNLEMSSWKRDMYYMRIRLKDTGEYIDLKVCPYCGKRMKRIPRTY